MKSLLHLPRKFEEQQLPRIVWLELEYYQKARKISQNIDGEKNQWQAYLNQLALLGFQEWLQQQIPDIEVKQENDIFHSKRTNLQVGQFKIQLITVDSLVEDFVTIREENITSPKLAAHFYVLVEVLEEVEQIRIHGVIRYDQLYQNYKSAALTTTNDILHQIRLDDFDSQINNLLLYIRFLEVEAIPLPSYQQKVVKELVNIGQWWSGIFEEGWQSIEDVLIPQKPSFGYLKTSALRTKKTSDFAVKRGKIFDFGLLLNGQSFVLTVNIKLQKDEEIGVLVKVHPHENEYCLPQDLKLKVTLNQDSNDAESKEVIARENDKIIQIEFSEVPQSLFKVESIYKNAVFTEEFVL